MAMELSCGTTNRMLTKCFRQLTSSASLLRTRHVNSRCVASLAASKKEGDISSVFNSLSGAKAEPLPQRFAQIKSQLLRGREDVLTASWKRLIRQLAIENEYVARHGSKVIPQIDFETYMSNPKTFNDQIKYRGVGVIKGVIHASKARKYKKEVEDYVRANPETKGFPQEKPAVFELYWSPAQVKARSHPNLISTQKSLMSLWRSDDPEALMSTSEPLVYADRVRIRQPGDSGFALGPHVDGGSVERWEPAGYGMGNVYNKVFEGCWEEYDPWESACRLRAKTDLYQGPGGCSMYRMFQGWLSMSETGPREGTLLVNPILQLSTAYFLLRPFFTPLKAWQDHATPKVRQDYLSEDNWVLQSQITSDIQGASPGFSQEITDLLHPHLNLASTMIHVPKIKPGDYVVWHCDTIHAVDRIHSGKADSSVLYIPVCPLTESNVDYLVRQRETFKSGHPGPDFPGGDGESAHQGRPSLPFLQHNVGTDGLRAMGFEKFKLVAHHPGEMKMLEKANEKLGLA